MDFLPHEADNQDEFVYASYQYYRHKSNWYCGEYYGGTGHREDVLVWLYKLGRDYNILFMDFEEFKRIMLGKHKDYSYWNGATRYYRRYNRYRSYYGSHSHYCSIEEYRVLKGFAYNGQAKKDNPTQNDWWDHKGFARSRRRTSGFQRGWKRDLKHFNKRKHRQLEREAISHEEYYRLHRDTWKIEDAWSWD